MRGVQGRERSPVSGAGVSLAGSVATADSRAKCVTYGRTLLHKAARKGNVDEVHILLTMIRASAVDDDGSTALHDAVLGGDDLIAAEVSLPSPYLDTHLNVTAASSSIQYTLTRSTPIP